MSRSTQHLLGSHLSDNGVDFRVWAPFAQSVSVLVGEKYDWKETALTNKDGFWTGFVENAEAGQLYKYKILTQDGTTIERTDPRARQLTASENGASVIINPDYEWEDTKVPVIPKEKQILYELHIGTFNRPDAATPGTFYTAIEKLDYLKDLGINTIELMPVMSRAQGQDWGYAITHLFAVDNAYGGRHGLLDFVKECHKRGIAVVLDVVYNHLFTGSSPDSHSDTVQSDIESGLWRFDGWSENEHGGIYFYNDARGETPWGARPDYGRTDVRQFILDNVTMWLTEYRISGLRVDSTIYMRNTRGPEGDASTEIPEAWTLLQEMTQLAHKIDPSITMYAEDSSVNDAVTKPVSEGGAGFDAQWGLSLPQTLRSELEIKKDPYGNSLAGEMQHYYNGQAFQKVVFGDSHDTAANGSVRINEAATPGNAGSIFARQFGLLANAITLTAPGIPMLIQGGEFMQQGSFSDWKMLEWEKTEQFAGIVLAHKHLISLRVDAYGNTAGLMGPGIDVFHQDNDNRVIAYHRWQNGGVRDDVIVIANFNDQRFKSYELLMPLPGKWRIRFNSSWKGYSKDFNETHSEVVETDDNNRISIELADYNLVILSQD